MGFDLCMQRVFSAMILFLGSLPEAVRIVDGLFRRNCSAPPAGAEQPYFALLFLQDQFSDSVIFGNFFLISMALVASRSVADSSVECSDVLTPMTVLSSSR